MRLLAVLGVCCVAGFVGCGAGVQSSPSNRVAWMGKVHGGNQPVVGATIQLYAAGTTGYGSAATPLLALPVVTLPDGSFSITADYTCPSATTQVYLTATGGNPGLALGTNNAALAEMVALGNCGALTPSTFVQINELTTVAAVFSLAPFMTDLTHVGTSATNAVGLASAMASANVLVPVGTGAAAVSSSPSALAAGVYDPGTLMPTTKVNSLGNTLAACVNSDGSTTANSGCGLLFSATTPQGGSAPTNTAQAALNIAQHLTTNVSAEFMLSTPNAPFQPALTASPSDWALGYGVVVNKKYVQTAALDGLGDYWSAGFFQASTPPFVYGAGPFATYSQDVSNIASFAMALDQNENLWLLSAYSITPGASSGVYEVSPSGSKLPCGSSCGPYKPNSDYPFAIAVDKVNHVWTVGQSGAVYEMTTGGTLVSPATGYPGLGLDGTYSNYVSYSQPPTKAPHMAFDSNDVLWVTNQISGSLTRIVKSGTTATAVSYTGGNLANPAAVAVDHAGSVWVGSLGPDSTPAAKLTKYNADGTVAIASFSVPSGCVTTSLAVYGAGDVWTGGNCDYSPAGVLLEGPLGVGYTLIGSNAAAVDASGSVWTVSSTSTNGSAYTKMVGVAVPTGASLSEALAAGTLGARP